MKLEGNVAIVTGAGQGIGEAYARRFGQEGARVAVVDINREKGEAVAESIRSSGAEAMFVACDVSSEEDTKKMAKIVGDEWGRIDTLLNNAAIFYGIDNLDYSYEYLKKIFSVNYFGAWLCCRAAFPYMKRQGKGSVINQTSTAAYLHFPMPLDEELASFHYSVTKSAINGMTHFMAGAVGIYGIRVNAIAPGFFDTRLSHSLLERSQKKVERTTPMGRIGQPGELGGVAVFLASSASSYITGQVVAVDGGLTA